VLYGVTPRSWWVILVCSLVNDLSISNLDVSVSLAAVSNAFTSGTVFSNITRDFIAKLSATKHLYSYSYTIGISSFGIRIISC
jgi:hypothetical protein